MPFELHEKMHGMPFREAGCHVATVLENTPDDIRGHAGVERSVATARKDVSSMAVSLLSETVIPAKAGIQAGSVGRVRPGISEYAALIYR